MNGEQSNTVKLSINYADVFDVARAHLRAIERPEAANKRFYIGSVEGICLTEMAEQLR